MDSKRDGVILVVDDEELIRMNAAELLEDAGYAVVQARDAAEALAILEVRPDVRLLFTDVQMPPGCDGIELARQVHERWPHVVSLVTSGGLQPGRWNIPRESHFMKKPYGLNMVKTVDGLIVDKT